jgi:Flp pilus assembly protein TadD
VADADARALYREGFQHFLNDRLSEAIACYRRALDADPALALGWNALAQALGRSGDVDGAIEAARRLVALEPDDPLAHTTLSVFYQKKGMIPEAEQEKGEAMRLRMRAQGKA